MQEEDEWTQSFLQYDVQQKLKETLYLKLTQILKGP